MVSVAEEDQVIIAHSVGLVVLASLHLLLC